MKESETRVEGAMSTRRSRRGFRGGRRQRTEANGKAPSLDRFLRENASALTFLGVTLGVFISRKFLVLPLAVGLMMAQEKLAAPGLARARKAVGV